MGATEFDKPLDHDLDELNSSLTPVLICETGWSYSYQPSSTYTFSCNWAKYNVLIIAIGNYGNIFTTVVVPSSEFSISASGRKVSIAYNGGGTWGVYQGDNTTIKIETPASVQTATNIRVWGFC